MVRYTCIWLFSFLLAACSKDGGGNDVPVVPSALQVRVSGIDGAQGSNFSNTRLSPAIYFSFNAPVNKSTAGAALQFVNQLAQVVPYSIVWSNGDSVLQVQPNARLNGLENYIVSVNNQLKSVAGGSLNTLAEVRFRTGIDSVPKFPQITTDSLLTLVQKQTFKYFWEFGHPVSGLARERNTSGDLVTTGGSGFGIMSMVVAVNRGFITRQQAVDRLNTMTDFLLTKAQRFKGAFPHWLNGVTGVTIPFSANDNGADLVETSFLAMGLLTARQYFDAATPAETTLRDRINTIVDGIEWNWFRRNNENVLYWHWSPDKQWTMNLKIQGWNECLVTYVLAASSKNFSIPDTVYHKGWARDGNMRNNKTFYGQVLPLGEDYGGPLFLSQYSFLGIDPNNLTDMYANYWTQQVTHTRINYSHCVQNPFGRFGYSDSCWGLTASDIPGGYTASSPTNDVGVIAPTAAVAAIPFAPQESIKALRFFYFTLGDKLWKEYGFIDAFKLSDPWFASSFLAIDQGPQIIMIENYRSKLLWQLFTSSPEVKAGMKKLGFTAPYL
ncbi:MAG TPA: glucoamylase family protein [Phnomibacter sp.]|nr:glucoamylase family protein [Phnomibacter sp.]